MKILFLSAHHYLPDIFGGMEKNTDQITQELIKLGIDVTHYYRLKGGINRRGVNHKLTRLFTRQDLSLDNQMGYPVYVSFDFLAQLDRVLANVSPDIIVLQGGYLYSEILAVLAGHEIPVVSYLHTPDPLPSKTGDIIPKRLTYIANSKFTAKSHIDKSFSLIVPPLVRSEEYAVETTRQSILMVNPSIYKGVEIAVQLAENFIDQQFNFVCAHNEQFEQIADEFKDYPNIKITKPMSDITKAYKNTKILLCPSQWNETWGRVITEAQMSGIPALASACGGLTESVSTGGITLPSSAPIDKWIDGLQTLLNNYDHYSALAKKRSQKDDINPAVIMQNLIKHFQFCIDA